MRPESHYRKNTKRNDTKNKNKIPQKAKMKFVNPLKIIIFVI